MQVVEGDLIALARAGRFDVIVHGCNCFHAMGAGVARAIAEAFPEALAADRATGFGDATKLGEVSCAEVGVGGQRLTIVNAYTQFRFEGPLPLVEYDALSRCFDTVAARFDGARIGYPLIGAGLAGGDWGRIAPLIDAALVSQDHSLVLRPGSATPQEAP
ncbi:hypothetical protein [Shimia sp. SDUM112013]|uniref:hypothetical protein n=1 Tax=Shimia sp. SDUM112013 TaxID=3136160 RepID=UPI0032EAEDDA